MNRKKINENINLVPLKSTNYSHLKYDTDGTQNDSVNKPLLDDIQTAAKAVGIVATITTAKTGHNKLVKSGKSVSRHMNGTGIDVAILNGIGAGGATNATNGNPQFRQLGNRLKDALVSMGYIWNKESGNDKAVLWQTDTGGNHWNHLHISNKSGQSSASPNVSSTSSDSGVVSSHTDSVTTSTTTSSTASDSASLASSILRGVYTQTLGLDKIKDSTIMGALSEEINRFKQLIK